MSGVETRSKTAAGASAPATFSFAAEFESFLSDPSKQALIQRVFCGPLLKEISELKDQMSEKNDKIHRLETRVTDLEMQNDALEQYTRRNSVRIAGIQEEDDECCETKVLDTLNSIMGVSPPITADQIDRLHRVGKSNSAASKPRSIIVKFTSYRYRSRVMSQRSKLKGTNKYINEDLTRKRTQVLFHCRAEKREGRLRDCWSSDGRILVKDLRGGIHLVSTLDDLRKLTTPSDPTNQPHSAIYS